MGQWTAARGGVTDQRQTALTSAPPLPSKLLQTTSSTLGKIPTSSSPPCPPCTVQVLPLPVVPKANSKQFSPFERKSCTRGRVVRVKKADCELAEGSAMGPELESESEEGAGGSPKTSVNL